MRLNELNAHERRLWNAFPQGHPVDVRLDPGAGHAPHDPHDPHDPGDPHDPHDPGDPGDLHDPGDPGDPGDLHDLHDPHDPGGPGDPAPPAASIRADVMAALLLGADTGHTHTPGDRPALRLTGARITGRLDLRFTETAVPVLLTDCRFDEHHSCGAPEPASWS
ncbi:hypothetical protein [Streptomyces sp. NPDC048392]|uniref:hypothetical protein n=1 Tax=Streptomyces sp. NPDC048392 TaxID=3365543 RepID=UPI00371217E9